MLLSLGAFALVSLGFSLNGLPAGAIAVGMLIWGMSYSGAPTLLQTALANVAGDGADVAQSMLVTVLNLAFAASGVVDGVLLQTFGAGAVAAVVPVLVVPALLIVSVAGRRDFHAHAPRIG
ncbi:MAG: hypothetical protein GAK37_02484 [Pseudomonas sp.]|nr:MAG: hypothetical protein GAK37_02484 [Pseudomonas sp.]